MCLSSICISECRPLDWLLRQLLERRQSRELAAWQVGRRSVDVPSLRLPLLLDGALARAGLPLPERRQGAFAHVGHAAEALVGRAEWRRVIG